MKIVPRRSLPKITSVVFSIVFLALTSHAFAEPMLAPARQEVYQYLPAADPRKSSDPSLAIPFGIGPLASGQDTLELRVGFADFSAPVDIYLGIYAPSVSPDILMVTQSSGLQPLSQGLVTWRHEITTTADQLLFGSGIPVSLLPADTYHLYALVTPHVGSTDAFYFWDSSFALPISSSGDLGVLGQLPAQFPMPQGSIDAAAAALAKEVLVGGSKTLPALMTAIQAAGIGIRNGADNIIVSPAQPSQGFLSDAYEVQAVALLSNFGLTFNLSDLSSDLGGVRTDTFGDTELANIILGGIRDTAQNGSGPVRFWARFIVELGRQSPSPYDLLGSSLVADIPLNPIQLNFILWRFAADVAVMTGSSSQTSGVSSQTKTVLLRTGQSGGSSPCSFNGTESFIMDWTAAASKYGFKNLYSYIDKFKNVIDPSSGLKAGQTIANTALAYAKYLATLALYNSTIRMDGNPPLHRTKSTSNDGEQRTFIFEAKYDTGNYQWLNCFRIMFNAMGLDFSLPNDGPIKGADVQWSIYRGGKIVEFAIGTDPVKGHVTDDKGITKVDLVGKRQNKALPADAKAVTKQAALDADVALKSVKVKDIGDIATQVPGGAKILLTLPIKLLERMHSLTTRLTFPVEDWTDDLLYRGTVKATMLLPYANSKAWETSAKVSFVKDTDQSRAGQDVYTTAEGTITQTIYTYPSFPGVPCYGDPDSFTDTYPIFTGDGQLFIIPNVEPVQYRATASISALTAPLKVHNYQECCSWRQPPCEDRTIEIDAQEHEWWLTGGSFMSAQPDGTLQGTYQQPMGASYEWKFTAEDNNL